MLWCHVEDETTLQKFGQPIEEHFFLLMMNLRGGICGFLLEAHLVILRIQSYIVEKETSHNIEEEA